jgi:hypothetical protein
VRTGAGGEETREHGEELGLHGAVELAHLQYACVVPERARTRQSIKHVVARLVSASMVRRR